MRLSKTPPIRNLLCLLPRLALGRFTCSLMDPFDAIRVHIHELVALEQRLDLRPHASELGQADVRIGQKVERGPRNSMQYSYDASLQDMAAQLLANRDGEVPSK